ncbi:MAG: PEP-CTERM sorting domain-containing protein [Phycisphaeraceae bacterium]|nr:PEP-CTERM sorting domain-containing protein [Phycisphaeraceae bacterium]
MMKSRAVVYLAAVLAGSSAWGAVSGNLIPNGTFEGTGFGTGSEDVSFLKTTASPLTQEEIDAEALPIPAWHFHPGGIDASTGEYFTDVGRWIGTGGISTWDDPLAAWNIGEAVAHTNRSVAMRNGQPTGVMDSAGFRWAATIIVQAPANHVAGAAMLDFDYFFHYWEGVPDPNDPDFNLLDTAQILRSYVLGIPEDGLPTWQDRWGIWQGPPGPNNPNGVNFATWDLVYAGPEFNSQQEWHHLNDGVPEHDYIPEDESTEWGRVSDGVWEFAEGDSDFTPDIYHDGSFTLDQAYAYYYIHIDLMTYSEPHPYFWLLGGQPRDEMSVAIDNVVFTVTVAPSFIPGDFNGDGAVTLSDINPFKLALTDTAAWQAQYPDVVLEDVDPNGDGVITLSDINPFKAILTGGSGAVVPEPASLSLLVVGALALARRR